MARKLTSATDSAGESVHGDARGNERYLHVQLKSSNRPAGNLLICKAATAAKASRLADRPADAAQPSAHAHSRGRTARLRRVLRQVVGLPVGYLRQVSFDLVATRAWSRASAV